MYTCVLEAWRNDKYKRTRVRAHINAVDKKKEREGERDRQRREESNGR
jgi:hypothetical protein